jgi:hypothetical protein
MICILFEALLNKKPPTLIVSSVKAGSFLKIVSESGFNSMVMHPVVEKTDRN